MSTPSLLIPFLVSLLLCGSEGPPSLEVLETRAVALSSAAPWTPEKARAQAQLQTDLFSLLDGDQLKTPAELRRVAQAMPITDGGFRVSRQRYELAMAALAQGDAEAATLAAPCWDQFLLSTGRLQHFGTQKGSELEGERFRVRPALPCLRAVLLDPARARAKARRLRSHSRLRALVEADQKARKEGGGNLSQAEIEAFVRADAARLRELKVFLRSAPQLSAEDYAHAALLMQHGSWFEDYALAHELALAATLLKPEEGRWLLAVSWDRMLLSAGYPQRIGTQYLDGALSPLDPAGFSDVMRKALGRKALADIPKVMGG